MGITEARGRLMERNSEDYVCPNCTGRKSQSSKLSTLAAGADASKQPATLSAARRSEPSPALFSQANEQTSTTAAGLPSAAVFPAAAPSAADEKAGEEVGIKGRIEKATNPSGKKKIKIFQPVGCCTVSVRFSTSQRCNCSQVWVFIYYTQVLEYITVLIFFFYCTVQQNNYNLIYIVMKYNVMFCS